MQCLIPCTGVQLCNANDIMQPTESIGITNLMLLCTCSVVKSWYRYTTLSYWHKAHEATASCLWLAVSGQDTEDEKCSWRKAVCIRNNKDMYIIDMHTPVNWSKHFFIFTFICPTYETISALFPPLFPTHFSHLLLYLFTAVFIIYLWLHFLYSQWWGPLYSGQNICSQTSLNNW